MTLVVCATISNVCVCILYRHELEPYRTMLGAPVYRWNAEKVWFL